MTQTMEKTITKNDKNGAVVYSESQGKQVIIKSDKVL